MAPQQKQVNDSGIVYDDNTRKETVDNHPKQGMMRILVL
jgi:hypothetical protein